MKKIYSILVLLPLVSICFAQIGPSWWQFLPEDYKENPYQRQTIMVQSADDNVVTNANSLEELWKNVNTDFVFPVDGVTNYEINDYKGGVLTVKTAPEQAPEDFTGSYTLIAGDAALYVLFKVVDDEVDVSKEIIEMHFAPYGEKFDPGREIHPEVGRSNLGGYWWADSLSHVWGWDTDSNMPSDGARIIKGTDYVDMAMYGSWTEVGAYKVDLSLANSAEVFPPAIVYSLKGDDKNILGDVKGGALPVAMQTLYEPAADGYYFLALIPWDIMPTGKLENVGEQISIAVKVHDYDANNFRFTNNQGKKERHTYNIWGGTDSNEAYWAIAFYGAVAELADGMLVISSNNTLADVDAFYANNQLVIQGDENLSVTIYDINGQIKGQYQGENQINLSYLNAGFYFANIYDSNGNRSIVKFAKANN